MLSNSNSSRSSFGIDEIVSNVNEDKLFVALGDEVKEGKPNLLWALQNSGGKKMCLLHVHVPEQMFSMMGGRFPVSTMENEELKAFRELERQDMNKMLREYLLICRKAGVTAEKLVIESDNIEKGIVELITQNGIKKLVMGAAAKKHYNKKMISLKSKKANHVNLKAPDTCQIMFVCDGNLIYTRQAKLEKVNNEVQQLPPQLEEPTSSSSSGMSPSEALWQSTLERLSSPSRDLRRAVSSANMNNQDRFAHFLSPRSARAVPNSPMYTWDLDCNSNPFQSSRFSTASLNDVPILPQPKEDVHLISPPSVLEGRVDDEIYEKLEQSMEEARNAKREAFEESLRRGEAEREVMIANRKAKAAENNYTKELKHREDIELLLMREKQEVENLHNQRDEVMQELRSALDHKLIMEAQIAESDELIKTLDDKIVSAVELFKSYQQEYDEMKLERDDALKLVEELKQKLTELSDSVAIKFVSEFTLSEIEEATRNFHPSLKIGEGGYGNIYKGLLRHTEVAIKMLHSHSSQGPLEYQQEVDVLGKLRHPNLITLIGTCPEKYSLIYEFLPNGSLEDRLNCKDNTAPLPWQKRIRIAAELCSVLIFLHSSKPNSIVHGDLKPSNILLDANFVSKLSDFGICRIFSEEKKFNNNKTMFHKTDPKGTFAYIDPEFTVSGELTTKSDVFSFGIILLQLLTGKTAFGIVHEVKNAVDNGNLKDILDSSAGDWPYVQAQQLANLGLRCVEMSRKNRPDLGSDVWKLLDPMRASCGSSSSSSKVGSEEVSEPPSYFICPIFQEVMRDPHVAADGFTYEAEALRGWLESGHDTSPMTNLVLEHKTLVPNLALRSAIREWLDNQHQQKD